MIVLTITSCHSNHRPTTHQTETHDRADSTSSRPNQIAYRCTAPTIIVFHPDSLATKQLLDADTKMEFAEMLDDFNHYTNWLRDTLRNTPIHFINATSERILIDNGMSQTMFTTLHDNQHFGCILVKSGIKPIVRNGIFTDQDYRQMIRELMEN